MRKKILFCTHEQFWPLTGGCTAGNFNIMKYFLNNGFEVTISTPLYVDVQELKRKYPFVFKPFSPFYMHRKIRFRMLKYILYGILSIFHLSALFKENTYDIIYVNNSVLAFSFIFLKPFIKMPVIIRYTDFLSGFLYEDKKIPKCIVHLLRYYEYRISNIFNRTYVVTKKMKSELEQIGQINSNKVIVTLDGVDGNVFKKDGFDESERKILRRELDVPDGATLVIYHGTIEPHHGEHILPEIIRRITDVRKDFYFLVIGIGQGYQKIKNSLQCNQYVRLLDFVEYDKIPKYIATSDIGIIPYQKNVSMDLVLTLKLLEYLSIGLPCVTFDLESVRMEFGKYEFVKISKNIDDFINNVIAIKDYEKSDEAADLIKQKFTWEQVGKTIAEDINNVVLN